MALSRTVSSPIAIVLTLAMSFAHVNIAVAQSSPDVAAPILELEELTESTADMSQVFTVLVADDRNLKDVTLYHRREGQSPFNSELMQEISDTGYYSATIETDPADLRAIEYYFQARDDGGNRSVEGFAFDPYRRAIVENLALVQNTQGTATEQASAAPFASIKWWHIALGVVAVGALASAGGGGGGSDNTVRVPLTVNLPGI